MRNESNSTASVSLSVYGKVIVCLLFMVLFIIGVIANGLVCYIILKYMKKSVTSLFLLNLSIADLFMTVMCAPFTLISDALLLYWPFGSVLCKTIPFIQGLSVFLSAFTHLVISFDRFIVIFYPLRPRIGSNKATSIIITVWVISAAMTIPLPIVNQLVAKEGHYFCEEFWPYTQSSLVYSMIVMVFRYFLPIMVISGTYIAIAIKLWTLKTPGARISQRDQRISASKRKIVRLAVLVASYYALSQLPRHVVYLITLRNETLFEDPNIIYIWIFSHFSSMSAPIFNPIIYFWINDNFQKNLRTLFWPCLSFFSNYGQQNKIHKCRKDQLSCTEIELEKCLITNEIKNTN